MFDSFCLAKCRLSDTLRRMYSIIIVRLYLNFHSYRNMFTKLQTHLSCSSNCSQLSLQDIDSFQSNFTVGHWRIFCYNFSHFLKINWKKYYLIITFPIRNKLAIILFVWYFGILDIKTCFFIIFCSFKTNFSFLLKTKQ